MHSVLHVTKQLLSAALVCLQDAQYFSDIRKLPDWIDLGEDDFPRLIDNHIGPFLKSLRAEKAHGLRDTSVRPEISKKSCVLDSQALGPSRLGGHAIHA